MRNPVKHIRSYSDGRTEEIEPIKEKDLPLKTQMAKNVARAAYVAVMDGFKRVDKIEYNRRVTMCRVCELYRQSDNRCSACGCNLKYKPMLSAWHCPLKKW